MNSIEFNLFAPYNESALLIGSFSDWQPIPMQKDDSGYFRVQVPLEDGVYQYKYRIQSKSWFLKPDEWVEITDPYVTQIDRESQNGIVRVEQGQRVVGHYEWKHDHVPLPANEDLIIYEMHISDFLGKDPEETLEEKFRRAIRRLDYLVDLGINAIELMPITEYPGDYRWGYLVRYYFAPESSYGPPEDLKRFIDECHARGIRVLMDGIYNHTDDQSPLLFIDRDYWYYHDAHYPDDPGNYWGPEFNYDRYDPNLDIKPAWKFIGDVVRFWIQEYHIDGIRYDAVRQLANYDFLHWIAQEAKQAAAPKPFYNIAEYIPECTAITCCNNGPMDGCWHESFRIFAIEHICGDNFNLDKLKEALDAQRQGYNHATSVINYLASHDREHTLTELGDRAIFDDPAFQRAKLGAVLLMTAVGVPMIWMGDEFGEYKHKPEVTTEPKLLEWSLLKNDNNRGLLEYYKKLIRLRKEVDALRTLNINFFFEHYDDRMLAYVRWNDAGSRAVVVANFSDYDRPDYPIPSFPQGHAWRDWITGEIFYAENDVAKISLAQHEARVLLPFEE